MTGCRTLLSEFHAAACSSLLRAGRIAVPFENTHRPTAATNEKTSTRHSCGLWFFADCRGASSFGKPRSDAKIRMSSEARARTVRQARTVSTSRCLADTIFAVSQRSACLWMAGIAGLRSDGHCAASAFSRRPEYGVLRMDGNDNDVGPAAATARSHAGIGQSVREQTTCS